MIDARSLDAPITSSAAPRMSADGTAWAWDQAAAHKIRPGVEHSLLLWLGAQEFAYGMVADLNTVALAAIFRVAPRSINRAFARLLQRGLLKRERHGLDRSAYGLPSHFYLQLQNWTASSAPEARS